ncbi:uncharacterized protein Z519_05365 [Cladophialophora bantiana CBS 173.52]|uniref:DUF1014 domain protein n=1 Tax=Cladophialophora bantiana (strain ATCC 10958 / CBS 173.52 / CDC B-1940 / NIH 8579) TaxID=1442370 RepID=A0A0D2IB65_CLAB1|nr:uncharacterized protein Z519_05365 [Cladophialophora bantiana CBS 173.52]KIW94049.1 hypothetical protein Z519_05365 [Cladophialophora bantiana CBS 173.52]
MPHNPFVFLPTQFIRIFVIVNITAYITTKAYLDSRAIPRRPRIDENYITTDHSSTAGQVEMAPKGKGENTKKVAGNARKAEAAAQKQAAADAAAAAREEQKWQQGAKDTSKKQAAAAKAAEQAAKKAEREAMLAEEEKGMRDKPKGANKKTAEKKSRGTLDLSQLDGDSSGKERALNASGIDNALDVLSLATESANDLKLDRHPERRFPAAYKAYEERRLPEIDQERPGLRRNQKIELIKKEFEKSDENPFNQAGNVRYDASKEEMAEVRKKVREGVENRLSEK